MEVPESMRVAAQRLIATIARENGGLAEYGQLSRRLSDEGFPVIPARSAEMDLLLGAIYDEEVPQGATLEEASSSTALVVHKTNPRYPGTGYWIAVDRRRWDLRREPGVDPSEADVEWWRAECAAAQERLHVRNSASRRQTSRRRSGSAHWSPIGGSCQGSVVALGGEQVRPGTPIHLIARELFR